MRRVICSILDVRTVWRNWRQFSLQLLSRTWFDKINKNKVITKNQCEKHKKSSLVHFSQKKKNENNALIYT